MQSLRRRSARRSASPQWHLRSIILFLLVLVYLLWSCIKQSNRMRGIDHSVPYTQSLQELLPHDSHDLQGLHVPQSNREEIWNAVGLEPPTEPPPMKHSAHPQNGFISLAFSTIEDLRDFSPAACKFQQYGSAVSAFLYDFSAVNIEGSGLFTNTCSIDYVTRTDVSTLSDWLESLPATPVVIIGLAEQDDISNTFFMALEQPPYLNTSLIRLPRAVLPYTEWMGALSLEELRHWNVPEISIAVITNDRPHSLHRLLSSLQRTLFYGDRVSLRINVDQPADPQTMRIVENINWDYGEVFIHHRIIHGGLLPAVVESWYPHCNDSYGLLLEDDIEVSPLSYAWVKMTLLRYRYGHHSSTSSQLCGISLYQQKNIELRPEGRRPFDARALFRNAGLLHPSTPYLSQIPCSWGAIYFPEQWREFHDYLSLRLSGHFSSIRTNIVPKVRSNKWSKSWKKYFIELVYLRGYVMLYPNYDHYVSFSTNHLEVGSHVKDTPEDEYLRKKRLFLLPLMSLRGPSVNYSTGLLDLPDGTLPDWDSLPVLDLMGSLSSLRSVAWEGIQRNRQLALCPIPFPASMRGLFCVDVPYQ